MNAIETLIQQPAAQAIAWALLQFVWQGSLIGLLAWTALAALRRSDADVRYVVATIGLALMLTMPVVTATQAWRASAAATSEIGSIAPRDIEVTAPAISGVRQAAVEPTAASRTRSGPAVPSSSRALEPWLPIMLGVWLCGVTLLTLRLVGGWFWIQRMRSRGAAPAAERLQHMAERLCRQLHIRRPVCLLESTLVDVPTVIGWLKPVVLVPGSALAGLAPQQLEAILAHELAHIRRHDYLVNLLQTLVETLLFYHPAVWWLSGRIRSERENCCDDLAVSLCGDPVTYAKALADLEELRGGSRQLVLAATGGSLLQRVRRLIAAPSHAGRGPGWLAGSAAAILLASIAAGAVGSNAFTSDQSAASQPPTAARESASSVESRAAVAAATGGAAPATSAVVAGQATPAGPGREMEARAREMAMRAKEVTAAAAEHDWALASAAASMAALAGAQSTAVVAMTDQAHAAMEAAATAVVAGAEAARLAGPEFAVAGIGQGQGHFTWSNGGEKVEVSYNGSIEFTDDDTDVKSLGPHGWLKISDGKWFSGQRVEFQADGSGNIQRRFWVGRSEKPFEPEGRQWLAQVLPRFIRQTGLGAPRRVARILASKGPAGVLAEISLIEGSWAKRLYFTELLKADGLDPRTIEQILAQAGREIDSDFELASLLIGSADRLLVDDAARKAYFDAARTIDSDFEMRRVYSAALKRVEPTPQLLATLLDASTGIDSDFEQASLLLDVALKQPLDATTRDPFFKALGTVASDFEHRRVLSALAAGKQDAATVSAMLESAATIASDFEQASLLLELVQQGPMEGPLRAPFFHALSSVDSSFERSRVLVALLNRRDTSSDVLLDVLRATDDIDSQFEVSRVLTTMASQHRLTGEARDLYIKIAERLGDFEQGRAMTALVKGEKR